MTRYKVTIDFSDGSHTMYITAKDKDEAEALGRAELEDILKKFYDASTSRFYVEEA
jgi:hypothetical protein